MIYDICFLAREILQDEALVHPYQCLLIYQVDPVRPYKVPQKLHECLAALQQRAETLVSCGW